MYIYEQNIPSLMSLCLKRLKSFLIGDKLTTAELRSEPIEMGERAIFNN